MERLFQDSDNHPQDAIALENADLKLDRQEDLEKISRGAKHVPNHSNRRYNLRKKTEVKSLLFECAKLGSSFSEGESDVMDSHFIMYNFSLNCLCILSN